MPMRAQTVRHASMCIAAAMLLACASAMAATPADTAGTPGEVRGIEHRSDGRAFIRLKLRLPGGDLRFTTLTYRVRDASLIEGVAQGQQVRFAARRIEGENTLTAIERAP